MGHGQVHLEAHRIEPAHEPPNPLTINKKGAVATECICISMAVGTWKTARIAGFPWFSGKTAAIDYYIYKNQVPFSDKISLTKKPD
jgi:hypothetical protein